jgi:hypothetical protein
MTREERIITELQRLARVANSISSRYAAHIALHRAACLNGNAEEMTQRRDELHTLLDSILDNSEEIQRLHDEVERGC